MFPFSNEKLIGTGRKAERNSSSAYLPFLLQFEIGLNLENEEIRVFTIKGMIAVKSAGIGQERDKAHRNMGCCKPE